MEEPASAQPEHTPGRRGRADTPAAGAPAELLARLRADRRAERWVPAFEREWMAEPEESRRTCPATTTAAPSARRSCAEGAGD
ncbi:hypothetical protein ABZ667_26605 [Streptomyces lavendulae]|uniref:hypothetical protein n=1 Tax=Streptomyces lavendulae TaxID=1914 RepID=UPI0033E87F09